MKSKPALYFINSATALLAAFTTVLFLCNIASVRLTQPHDPLFAIPMNSFFWILGFGAMAVTFACIFIIQQTRFKLLLIFWFASNLIIYRFGLQWQGVHSTRGYVGALAHTFNLSNGVANGLLNFLFLYLFIVSAALLLWNFLARPEVLLKATCMHCGGRIAFPPENLGQTISCPHCRKETALRKSDLLKMACFFCKEHIEFPTHAIGEKIRCPHCKMDITLKEPA